jgi:hypothetical protein
MTSMQSNLRRTVWVVRCLKPNPSGFGWRRQNIPSTGRALKQLRQLRCWIIGLQVFKKLPLGFYKSPGNDVQLPRADTLKVGRASNACDEG